MTKQLKSLTLMVMLAGLLVAGCNDGNPVAETDSDAPAAFSPEAGQAEGETFAAKASKKEARLLTNVPVGGTLEDGRSFQGKVTITRVDYDEERGFLVTGYLKGRASNENGKSRTIQHQFSRVPATLNESAHEEEGGETVQAQQDHGCPILFLNIGPIFLDLLGLQLDLSEITLDLTAVPGSGNLLGNLLCAVADLLDPLGFLDELRGTLADLLDLISQINDILS